MNYIYSNDPNTKASLAVFNSLDEHLSKGERVLWLLAGGSSIPLAVFVCKMLSDINLENLFVSLTDERYGPVGHMNENWQQLIGAGLKLPGANLYRPLIGADMKTTASQFDNWLAVQFDKANYKIGVFGVGIDGHTAGIKPNSPAINATGLATAFVGDDYERVTITFNAINRIDEAAVQISGPDKSPVIRNLLYDDIPLDTQPAQILKTIPKATVYANIHKEDLK